MDLSIIIALYNTEKYIKKCIESIYENNSLNRNDFEVIVINDGSYDNSPKIVEELQSKYANLILLNKKNGGQSSARNQGFKIAKGKYIFCLDSDDFIDASELAKAIIFCEQNELDLLPINLRKYDEDFKALPIAKDNYASINKIISGGEFLNQYVIYGSMCRYIYKRSIIEKNNLYLTEGIYHEDEEFVIKYVTYSKKISYKNHSVYHQIVRNNSTTKNQDASHRLKLLNDLTTVIVNLNLHLAEFESNSLEYIGLSKKIEQLLISLFLRMKKDEIYKQDKISLIKRLIFSKLFPLDLKYSKIKFKCYAMVVNFLWKVRLY